MSAGLPQHHSPSVRRDFSIWDNKIRKGIGPRTAEAVVLYLDDPHRFKSGDELASYAGLVPKQLQSGAMNRPGQITHRGPGLLRSLLVESAWTIYRHNAWAQAFVNKISHGGKARRKLAIVALARKVLIILCGACSKAASPSAWQPERCEKK